MRSEWDVGVVFYAFNLAGEIHKRATSEVLCLDALVCEDAWVVAGVCFYREYICTPSQTHKTRYADSCPAFTNFETKHNIFYQWPSQTQQKC